MYKSTRIIVLITLSLMAFAFWAWGAKIAQLEEIRVEEVAGRTRVVLINKARVDYTCFNLKSPPRLIINFVDDNVYSRKSERIVVNKGVVEEIRCRYKENGKEDTPYLDYIVLQLNQPSSFHAEREKNSIIIDLKPTISDTRVRKLAAKSPNSIKGKEKRIRDLEDCLRTAIDNSKTVKIAEEEVRLAELKVREATRGLFPSVAAKVDRTDGNIKSLETGGVDAGFRETEFGLQIGQSLYQGGKFKSTFTQAKVKLEMAEKKYDKTEQDLIFDVKKAYYNLVSSRANVHEQEKLLRQAESILEEVRKKHKLKLITREELLNVQSQHNQVRYQKTSEEKDSSLALLTLKQLLNLDEPVSVEVDTQLDFQDLGVSLEQSLELAEEYNLDLAISKLSMKFAEMGKKIARSDQKFKIDLSGFYGRGGGAYKTEELKLSHSWYAGIKVSKTLGGSTISSGYTSDQTNPKLGQSSRTDSNTGSVTLSLFDNLKNLSEAKEAEIEYEKAVNEVKKTEKKMESEVKESYFNYEKSLIQLEAVSKEIEFRKEQERIAREKGKRNLARNSEVLGAEINLTSARTSYNEALAYYHIALASLNKAIGIEKYKRGE
ncbi:TolC family protein [bacterium]|nr:TolC family protein [bacterium]NIN91636.1 TolC family protein [bacterium]NIO17984.1 TolC family protein [bacterium]NIO72949.1 TolC family protein [bacterium]